MGSIVTVSEAGAAEQPSPSIWKSCKKGMLVDFGTGFYFHQEFLGGAAETWASGEPRVPYGALSLDCDDDTVTAFKTGEVGGFLDLETDGDDNDAWALFTEPFAQVVIASGNRVWFEVAFEVGAVADQSFAVLFAEEAALATPRDVISDDAAALIGESYFGFRILNDDTNGLDAVYKLDAGTEVALLNDVTNASAIATADQAAIVADTTVKVGMVFDGNDQLVSFVDGIQVNSTLVDTAIFPDSVQMGLVVALKTGTGAAQSAALAWVRAGHEIRR